MKKYNLFLLLFFLNPILLFAQKHFGGKWSSKQNPKSDWDPSCTRPTLLVEEDFTDSLFNGYNAGPNGSNWAFFSSGVAFRPPNARTTFPMAVTRTPFLGAGGWAGVLWGNRINPSAGHVDGNLVEYSFDKKDDVFVSRFRAFSDFGHTNERAGVEVANMEYRSVLCPPPDFCHDLSFEAKQCFYTRPQDDLQLETNIENTTDRSPFGARRAHYNNLTTKADLAKEYTNLVIWRNDTTRRKCNIEQWGEANYGDFWLDSHMVSKLDPENRYAKVSEVQISLFAANTNFTLKRDEVSVEQAQIGILNVHSGFTKISDFNLDYKTDSLDFNILKSYLGRTDSATLRRGDANNDQKMSISDAKALSAYWSNENAHPDSASAFVIFEPNPNANPPLSSGKLKFQLKNIQYLEISAPAGTTFSSPSAALVLPGLFQIYPTGLAGFFHPQAWTEPELEIQVANPSGGIENSIITVNYAGSCQSDGFSFGIDSLFLVTGLPAMPIVEWHRIGNQYFKIPRGNEKLKVALVDALGKIHFQTDCRREELSQIKIPKGYFRLKIQDPGWPGWQINQALIQTE
jgi:hypothetical protein